MNDSIHKHLLTLGLSVLYAILLILILHTAWLSDDAFITFRVVDNFFNGYGLRWNPTERVQVYTHPLWMILLVLVRALTGDLIYSAMILGVLLTFAAILISTTRILKDYSISAIFILILICSTSFLDFTTSGLENSLAYLLFALYLHSSSSTGRTALSLIYFSLITITRYDLALIAFPSLFYNIVRDGLLKQPYLFLKCLAPLMTWICFATIYYGSPFPNTAFAKLNTGIPSEMFLRQGLLYFEDSFRRDPICLTLIFTTLIFTSIKSSITSKLVACGVGLYLIYILNIGGDFMTGRFFSVPYFVMGLSLCMHLGAKLTSLPKIPLLLTLLFGGCMFIPRQLRQLSPEEPVFHGIMDERIFYSKESSLTELSRNNGMPTHWRAQKGLSMRENPPSSPYIDGAIGALGYYAGPRVTIIDMMALTDPFLSRLPIEDPVNWRIGHFIRPISNDYIKSIMSGENLIRDLEEKKVLDRAWLLARAPILSVPRALAIYEDLFGHSIESRFHTLITESFIETTINDLSEAKPDGTRWSYKSNVPIPVGGVKVNFTYDCEYEKIQLSLDHNNDHEIFLMNNKLLVGKLTVKASFITTGGLKNHTISLPPDYSHKCLNSLVIYNTGGDSESSIGHIFISKK